jgi:hypothetical protein
MATAVQVQKQPGRKRKSIIWLGDVDPEGRPMNPVIKALAYANEYRLVRYRKSEMKDKAVVATLIESAAYSTSKVANERHLKRPDYYLYQTYTNLVDKVLREAVEAFDMERYVVESIGKPGNRNEIEDAAIRRLSRQQVLTSMDAKGRGLWNRHLLGFDTDELGAEEGQDADYIGMRLRRAVQQALRRLVTGVQ